MNVYTAKKNRKDIKCKKQTAHTIIRNKLMKTILITAIQMKVSGQTDKTKPCNLGGEKWDLPRITIINRKCKVNLLSDFTM